MRSWIGINRGADVEVLTEAFAKLGVPFTRDDGVISDDGGLPTSVIQIESEEFGGYAGFFARWVFDAEGGLLDWTHDSGTGIWGD